MLRADPWGATRRLSAPCYWDFSGRSPVPVEQMDRFFDPPLWRTSRGPQREHCRGNSAGCLVQSRRQSSGIG